MLKDLDMQAPKKNEDITARPRPTSSVDNPRHVKQVEKAFDICFQNNKDGLELLAKI